MTALVAALARTWNPLQRRLGPFAPLLLAWLAVVLFLATTRAVFAVAWHDAIAGTEQLWLMFPIGLRMDTVLACYLLLPAAVALAVLPAGRVRDALVAAWFALWTTLIVFLELSTPPFIAEFDKRPDRIFLEYLGYPREQFAMMWGDHKLALIGVPLITGLVAWLAWRGSRRLLAATPHWSWWQRLLALPLAIVVLFYGGRSSLEPRPANISTASFSTNRLVNELTLNSTYTVAYAANSMRNEVDSSKLYGEMPWDEVRARVARYQGVAASAYADPQSIQHRQAVAAVPHPRDLVIVLEESLGATYTGHLGGVPVTPNIDRLSKDGIDFTQMYATGTRTARGMEAVVAGFPPSAQLSVLKLPGSQSGFFTLASLLKRHGYDTLFVYGGAANFDNMRAFYLGNGFDRVIEERDFPAPGFVASWGVSDEDLLVRTSAELAKPHARPLFVLVMSSSNHDPFEIPAGKIEPYNAPLFSRENAIKYSDYAIGRFFELERAQPAYADRIYMVAADHDARVFGAPLVPIEHFRIPAFIIGPGVPVGPYDRVASQIDLAPTLLGLLGVDAPTPLPGRDLLRLPADDPGRALMQYDLNHGFRVGDRLVVHQPKKPAQTFRIEGTAQVPVLVPIADDPELTRDALAHVLWPGEVYRQKLYKVED
jgi:phosphoglycerol transferase MdoB-like AlkP superfamily enzyme